MSKERRTQKEARETHDDSERAKGFKEGQKGSREV